MAVLDDTVREVRTRIALRDHDQLRHALSRIRELGWDSAPGTELVDFVRQDLVRPMVIALGIRGTAAGDAEAAAWAAAWQQLTDPRLSDAAEPWGLVRTVARHAMVGELIAARYSCEVRKGWRRWAQDRQNHTCTEVLPVDDLLAMLEDTAAPEPASELLPGVLPPILRRLTEVGWAIPVLDAVIDAIVDGRLGIEPGGACAGWRPLAAELHLPPWRLRRLTIALLGGPRWPGLLHRGIRRGPAALDGVDCCAAVRSTVEHRMRSPESEAVDALARARAQLEVPVRAAA